MFQPLTQLCLYFNQRMRYSCCICNTGMSITGLCWGTVCYHHFLHHLWPCQSWAFSNTILILNIRSDLLILNIKQEYCLCRMALSLSLHRNHHIKFSGTSTWLLHSIKNSYFYYKQPYQCWKYNSRYHHIFQLCLAAQITTLTLFTREIHLAWGYSITKGKNK